MVTKFIPFEKLDKTQKYCIVGVPKAGTSSLYNYMISKGFDITRRETRCGGCQCAENYDHYFRTPILVVRNPIERAWSQYRDNPSISLKDACDLSFYKAIVPMYDALIFSLEYLKTLPDFPHSNITDDKSEMTPEIKQRIIKELKL